MTEKPTYEELEKRVRELEQAESERLQAQEALAEETARKNLLIDQSRDGIVVLAEDGSVYEANRRFADTLGYTFEELLQLHVWDWDTQWTKDQLLEMIREVDDSGDHFETNHRRKDGTICDVETSTNGATIGGRKYVFCISRDVTERKRAEESLRKSETTVRKKLQSILEPESSIEALDLADIIDCQALQAMMDDFYRITHISSAVVDLSGRVLVATGWQDVCTKFHRVNPRTLKNCRESDIDLSREVPVGTFKAYRCKNNLWDMATPIVVGGRHLGNIFLGQFFYENEVPDYELFRSQARQYGFDEGEYLAAVDRVPCWSRETVELTMAFYAKLAGMISTLSYSTVNLSRALSQQDITLRRLGESESRNKAILSAMPDMMFLFDHNGVFLDYHAPNESELAVAPELFVGRKVHDVLTQDIAEITMSHINEILENGETPPYGYELEVAGETRFYESRMVACQGTGFLAIVKDITEHKRAEEERDKLQARLVQAHKMEAIGTLAGGIAHDFNNILSIIMGNTEMAMMDVPELSPAQDNLKEVRGATLRARELVKQILMFARQKEHTVSNIRLEPIAKESLKMLRSSIPTTVEIRKSIEKGLPPVLADPSRIQQVIMNLCTNAGQAMEAEGGTLTFTLDSVELEAPLHSVVEELPPGRYVRMQVTDTGPGIPTETLDRLFDPFFTTKGVGQGTGLGLPVVHGIVQDRKGGITVDSEEGRGATFTVYLPASEGQSVEAKAEQKTQLPRGTERVLFVDDEPMIMEMGRQMLERLGYTVETRASGTDALECFRQDPHRFDLVVTDMTMPGMRGDRLAEEIMSIRKDVPIILCTGYSRQISKEKAEETGVRAFVMKPLTQYELANTVRRVLDEA